YSLNYLFAGGPAPPAPGLGCGTDATPDTLGCQSYGACGPDPVLGQSDFFRTTQGSPPGTPGRAMEGDTASADRPASPGGRPAPGPAASPDRTIEESDIYKLAGSNLFVLNRYRGLQVLDLADLDHPRLIGRAPIFGYPKEMYVRGDRAYVIV